MTVGELYKLPEPNYRAPLEKRLLWLAELVYRGIGDCDIPEPNFRYWAAITIEATVPELVEHLVGQSSYLKDTSGKELKRLYKGYKI